MIYEFPHRRISFEKKFTFILKFHFVKLKFKMKKNFSQSTYIYITNI